MSVMPISERKMLRVSVVGRPGSRLGLGGERMLVVIGDV